MKSVTSLMNEESKSKMKGRRARSNFQLIKDEFLKQKQKEDHINLALTDQRLQIFRNGD